MNRYLAAVLLCLLATTAAFSNEEEAEIEVGPDKGVVELAADKSFKLSPEAKQTFGIRTVPAGIGTFSLPNSAIVNARTESQIFRVRDGFFRSVHFKLVRQNEQTTVLQAADLKAGDEVVIQGIGFLRIVAAQLGEKEGTEKPETNSESSAAKAKKEAGHD